MDLQGFLVWENPGFRETDVAEKSPCGRYIRYKRLLGRGAFKDVYKGFDHADNVEIAWNQICIEDETTLKSPERKEKLCSEAVLLKSLNHRNIMSCSSFWLDFDNKTVNMITELFEYGCLRHYMKKLGNVVDVHTIKNLGRQILQGLHYLHTRNPIIIHRDLKCDNLFVDASGEVKIGDFGLATTMERAPLRDLAGTPEFMAPEYYDEEYNELVDIYAFGMCLMELATSEYPYSECTNPAQIFKKVSTGIKPVALGKVKDREVKEMIEKCMLPASLRPSALELLKDPFFSSEIPMEMEHNSMDASSVISSCSSEAAKGADSIQQCIGMKRCSGIYDSILSDISALYNSHDAAGLGKLTTSCSYQSSVGDVSMNSRITYASSSGAVSKKGVCFSVSKPSLQ